jgi:hypothetical protein
MVDNHPKTVKQRILEFLTQNVGVWFSSGQLRDQLDIRFNPPVFNACKELASEGSIERERRGVAWYVRFAGPKRPLGLFDWIPPGLREVAENDWREVERSLTVEAWKAVVVLSGACLEAALIAALRMRAEETAKFAKEEFRRTSIEDLPLAEKARLACAIFGLNADVTKLLRTSRNLIHPINQLHDGHPTAKRACAMMELTEECVRKISEMLAAG